MVTNPGRHIVSGHATAINQVLPARILALPDRQTPLAKEIFVVEAEFFQAGARHIREFEFGLFGCSRRLAPFRDILDPGPCRLDHLVMSTTSLINEAVAKTHGDIERQLSDLKALELPVASMHRYERLCHHSPTLA
jgi:hypothetical protein